jgi:hypothetical protein
MSCPSGFEVALPTTCRIVCPSEFKYVHDGTDRCVSKKDPRYSLKLKTVPQGSDPSVFSAEQSRFLTEFIQITKRTANQSDVDPHDQVSKVYTEAIDTLKPFRSPTQPSVDIETARLDIRKMSEAHLRALQISLFFVILALLQYFVLPSSIVHGSAFLTLCIGFSLAIYLSNK